MIVSAHQPYFAPFPGYFYKALLSDVFILLDAVQFPRGTTWISRNRFKNDQGTLWMTIPVQKKGLGLQRIDQVRICHDGRWERKHMESLRVAYRHAPYLEDHEELLEGLFDADRLIDLNLRISRYIMDRLSIRTQVVRLSELGVTARGPALLPAAARELGASRFLAQAPAGKFLNPALFEAAGIELSFFQYPSPVYPQLWGEFIPNLSVLDLIFNCGADKARKILLGKSLSKNKLMPVGP
ncbi:MAG: WbqC family protein [Thermodesulfobacteriota bacterium]|nr:WbqC family protein [Thermodesulfobacteriota bacterium]